MPLDRFKAIAEADPRLADALCLALVAAGKIEEMPE